VCLNNPQVTANRFFYRTLPRIVAYAALIICLPFLAYGTAQLSAIEERSRTPLHRLFGLGETSWIFMRKEGCAGRFSLTVLERTESGQLEVVGSGFIGLIHDGQPYRATGFFRADFGRTQRLDRFHLYGSLGEQLGIWINSVDILSHAVDLISSPESGPKRALTYTLTEPVFVIRHNDGSIGLRVPEEIERLLRGMPGSSSVADPFSGFGLRIEKQADSEQCKEADQNAYLSTELFKQLNPLLLRSAENK
jgi:hypothetical protein